MKNTDLKDRARARAQRDDISYTAALRIEREAISRSKSSEVVMARPMSETRPNFAWRNHYVPKFYLRRWVTSEGKLWAYKRIQESGKLDGDPVSPTSTGFSKHLYTERTTVPYSPPAKPDAIETEFFGKIDNDAGPVLPKLIDGTQLSAEEFHAWAIFINSLLERSPQALAPIHAGARTLAAESFEKLRSDHSTPDSRARLEEVLKSMDLDTIASNGVIGRMVRETQNPAVIDYFLRCRWRVLPLTGNIDLLTTDTPVVVNAGVFPPPIYMMTLALSPRHLMLIHDASWDNEIDAEFVRLQILNHNPSLMRGQPRYVYSHGELTDGPVVRNRVLVEKMFGTDDFDEVAQRTV